MKKKFVWIGLIVAQFSLLDAATWILDANGNWSVGSNWDSGVVPGTGLDSVAVFGSAITAPRTVSVDGNFILSNLSFNSSFSYTIDGVGNNALNFNTGTIALPNLVNLAHFISAPINFTNLLTIDTNSVGSFLTISGQINSTADLIKQGLGTLILTNTANSYLGTSIRGGTLMINDVGQLGTGDLTIEGGTIQTTQTLTHTSTMVVATGTIDVNNGIIFTQAGNLAGAGPLTKIGGGTFSSTRNGTFFTGAINVEAGTFASTNLGGTDTINLQNATIFQPLGSFSTTRPITLQGAATILVDGTDSATLTGPITGSFFLTKEGTGTLLLEGQNTFVNMALNQGTVSVSNGNQLGNGELIFNNEATLITTQNLERTLTLRMNNGANNGIIQVADGTTFTQSGEVLGAGKIVKEMGGTLLFSRGDNSYTGMIDVRGGVFAVASLGGTSTINLESGTQLQPTGTFSTTRPITLQGPATILVDGTDSATLTGPITGSFFLKKEGTGTLLLEGQNTFADLELNGGTVSVSNSNQLGNGELVFNNGATLITTQNLERTLTLRMNNGANDGIIQVANGTTFTQSGEVLGAGKIVKEMGGALLFSRGDNSYTGMIDVRDGLFAVASLGGTGIINLESGTQLQPIGTFSTDRPLNIQGAASVVVNESDSATIGGVLTGTLQLTKEGTGTLSIPNSSIFTGPINITGGTFIVDSLGGTAPVTLSGGTTFGASGSFTTDRPFSLLGGGAISVASGATLTLNAAVSDGGSNFDFAKAGDGTLVLASTSNAYLAMSVNGGTLVVSDVNQLGNGNLVIQNGATLSSTQTLTHPNTFEAENGAIDVASGTTFTQSGELSGAGPLTKKGGGTFSSIGNAIGLTAAIDVEEGTLALANIGGKAAINLQVGTTFQPLNGFFSSRPITLEGGATIFVDGSDNVTLGGPITGAFDLIKQGTGTLVLQDENAYTNLELNQGILSISNGNQLGTAELVFNNLATLITTRDLEHPFTLRMDNGANDGIIQVKNGTTFTQSGEVVGAGKIVKQTGGTLSFSGQNNSHTGDIDVQEGTFIVGSLGSGGTVILGANTTFQPLNSFGSSDRNFLINGASTLLVDGADTFTAGGTFTGTDTLRKTGTGSFVFSNANVGYVGDLIVDNGTVEVASGSSLINNSITVNPGGILTGDGTLGAAFASGGRIEGNGSYASLELSQSSVIAPGNSIGTIEVTGNYTQLSGSVYEVEIEGSISDQILVTGIASLGNGSILRVFEPLGTVAKGSMYDILVATGGIDQLWTEQDLVNGLPFTVTLEGGNTIARLAINATFILNGRDVGSGNPKRVRDYIDSFDLDQDEDLLDLMLIAETLNDEDLRLALDQMHPALYGAFPLMNLDTSAVVSGVLQRQLLNTELYRDPCDECPHEYCANYFWVTPFGFFAHVDRLNQMRGYRDASAGLVVGYDHSLVDDHVLIGTFVGYDYSNLDWRQDAGKADIHQLLMGLRSGFSCTGWVFDLATFGGVNFYDSTRNVHYASVDRTAKEDHMAGHLTSHVGFLWHDLQFFELFGSVAYNYLHQGTVNEDGADSLDLTVFARDDHYLRSELGGRFRQNLSRYCGEWNMLAGGSWVYKTPLQNGKYTSKFIDFSSRSQELIVDTFDKSIAFFSPEIRFEYVRDSINYHLLYKGEFGKDYLTNQVVFQMGWNF
ncbi:MAG: autotransporter-associated beta strand repeat-containing protein [Chlamydiota bacterium]